MDVRHLAFLARQPSAALKTRARFLGMPKRGLAIMSNRWRYIRGALRMVI